MPARDDDVAGEDAGPRSTDNTSNVNVTVAFPFSNLRVTNPFSRGPDAARLAEIVAEIGAALAPLVDAAGRENLESLVADAREIAERIR